MPSSTIRQLDLAIGNRVRDLRKQQNISQQTLASALGVSFQQVQKYEKGRNRISAGMLLHIANTLGLPVSLFLSTPTPQEYAAHPLVKEYARLTRPLLREAALLQLRCLAKLDREWPEPR